MCILCQSPMHEDHRYLTHDNNAIFQNFCGFGRFVIGSFSIHTAKYNSSLLHEHLQIGNIVACRRFPAFKPIITPSVSYKKGLGKKLDGIMYFREESGDGDQEA